MFISTNEEPYFRQEIIVVEQESLFKYVKMESFIKTSPNGKSGGIDGVLYEDLKDSRDEYLSCISQYNECNINQSSLIMSLERSYYSENSEKEFQHRRPIYTT